uniref:RING-type E3 ubiquitin transferase n=1 Tax=Fagus sylvatica TaxID=28930 RepID=A0A2N9F9D2_FAGSY
MMDLKSKKAIYVCLQAPVSCQIQFICKGLLIHTREAGILDGAGVEVRPSQNYKTGPSNSVRSQSVGQHIGVGTTSSGQVSFCGERIASVGSGTDVSSLDDIEELPVAEGSSDEWIESSIRYPPGLDYSTSSSSRAVDIARISSVRSEGSENGLGLSTLPQSKESFHSISPPSLLVLDGSIDDTLYAQLEKAMAEAENARREVFQEADRRGKAEKDAVEAMHRAQVSESLCAEEFKQRKEIEEALANKKEEHEKVKIKLNKVMEDLWFALDQKSSLESQIAESHEMINGLELRIVSAVELFQTYKKERDEFLVERDNALKEAEEPRRNQGEFSSTQMPQFSEFSFSEIEKATQNFDPSLKMGEGRHGNIYKGFLREIQVAIKVLQHHNFQDPSRFQSEVRWLNCYIFILNWAIPLTIILIKVEFLPFS